MLPQPHPSVIFQRLAEGAVLFAPSAEIYFGLNEVGARVWELLPPTSASIDDLCARLGAEHPDVTPETLRQDVTELLAQLISEGLALVPPGEAATGAGATP